MRNLIRSAAAALAAAAGASAAPPPEPKPTEPPVDASVSGGNTAFGLEFLKQLSAASAESNLVFSPYSLSVALAMTRAGAKGETLEEMSRVLRQHGAVDAGFETLAGKLRPRAADASAPVFTLQVANRLWAAHDLSLNDDYQQLVSRHYGAAVGRLDFARPAVAAAAINEWVKEQTKALIERLVTEGDIKGAGLVLTNAVYFKGDWASPFTKESTHPGDFTTAGGEKVRTPMMRRTGPMKHASGAWGQAVSLPYSGGASMLVVLPGENGMKQTIEFLCGGGLATVDQSLKTENVRLGLPKAKLSSNSSVLPVLKAMGMRVALGDHADFSGIFGSTALKIGDVIHAAEMRIDEKGTEAAAATAVIMRPTAAPHQPEQHVIMEVDRPYLVLIRHDATGALLFVAKVADPRSGEGTR